MNKSLFNPFKFGDPVEGDFYLPRPQLMNTVTQFLENKIHTVLIGPRRFGKTSFVWDLLKTLEKKSYTTLFVDIFNITSHRDFLQQMLRVLRQRKNWLEKVLDFVPRLRPKMSAGVDLKTGNSSFEVSLDQASEKDVKEMIQDLLQSLEKIGDNVIIVIDEFQKVTEIDDAGWLEATLRTFMQQLKNTSFLFTGSRKRIIYDMLNNHNRPFYRACQPIEFPSFGTEFTEWIVQKFTLMGIQCENGAIDHLRKLVQDTPHYVQMVCFHLIAIGVKNINISQVQETLSAVVRQNAYAYQTLLNTLSAAQQRSLRLAAKERNQIFSKALLSKYEIQSAPALASSIKALKDKGILDEEGTHRGKVIFDDPLFAIWLSES